MMNPIQKPPWKVRLIVLAAVILVALYGLDRLILFMKTPFVGIYGEFRSRGFYIQSLAGEGSSEIPKSGAYITSIEGVPVEEWLRSLLRFPQKPMPQWSLEKPLRIGVTDESNVSKTVSLALRYPEWKDFLQHPFWLWILAVFILFCGAYLQFHYSDQQRVQILSILLLAAALSIFNYSGKHLLMQIGAHLPWMLIIRLGALCVISSSWLTLILIFLERRNHLRFPLWVPWVIYGFPPVITAAIILSTWGHPLSGIEVSSRVLYLIAGVTVIFTFWILMRAYRTTGDAVLRAQLKWILWGHVLGMSPYVLLYSLPKALIGSPLINYNVSLVFLPLIVFSYLFAFYRYRLMDVDRVIHGSIVYGISVTFLFILYLLALWILHEMISPPSGMESWIRTDLFLLFGAVLVFNPLKNVVQKGIDRTLFPERLGLPAFLIEGSNRLTRASSLKEIMVFLLEDLAERISVEKAALVLRQEFGEGWEFCENPEGCIGLNEELISDINKLSKEALPEFWNIVSEEEGQIPPNLMKFLRSRGVTFIFPMVSGDDLWGFYILGPKMTKGLMTFEEIRVIGTLCTQAAHMIGNTRLMEGLRRTNRSLADLSHRLMEAERMADLGEGAAILAHELKNPLGIVRGSAEILLRAKEPSKNEEILCFILEEVDRLSWTIDEFLQFARMAPPSKSDVDLNDLVQSAAFLWESRKKSSVPVSIRYQLDHNAGKVSLDSRQIYHVLLNIFTNAEEAMPGGGKLLISTGSDSEGRRAWISVKDTGKGISREHLEKVFDRFFTTKDSGLGLGLAVVKKVMEAHGGSVEILSTEGSGTEVALYFPIGNKID
jgi:signal transduction histidine kinase/branched-subunit amino acid transport protein